MSDNILDDILGFFSLEPDGMSPKDKEAKNDDNLEASSDNLAVPEVHVGKGHGGKKEKAEKKDIEYDMLAVPEVHLGSKRKNKK